MIETLYAALFHLVIPLALFSWLAFAVEPSRVGLALKSLSICSYLLLLIVAGNWSVLPWQLGYVHLGLWALLTVVAFVRTLRAPKGTTDTLRAAYHAGPAALCIGLFVYALSGHRPHAQDAVELAFPLRDGTFVVAAGGSNFLLNPHLKTLKRRFRSIRGQSYAVDIVKLNRYAIRSTLPIPEDLADYAIFDEPVYAPCSGRVVGTQNALPDLVPPARDRMNLAGNFVAIDCEGVRVLLAHLKRQSVTVRPNEQVTAGQLIGRVGNSGNTSEPHLHVHAERPTDSDTILDAEPMPMRYGAQFLAKNDRITPIAR